MTGSMALPSLMTTLIPWAISSVLLILAVLAVRWLTRDRLSSVNRYALWLVVLIRLLIPARALNRLAEWLLKLLLSSITTMSNGHALR